MSDLEKLQAVMSEYLQNGVDARQLYQYYSHHVMFQHHLHLQQQRQKQDVQEKNIKDQNQIVEDKSPDTPMRAPSESSEPPRRESTDSVVSRILEGHMEQKIMPPSDAIRRPVVSLDRVRHKRQTLQDMARPLKHWLYKHRDNPYPTKSEKMALAVNSQMTLTQVSNWFANARRRLKNTVRDPELNWESRIKMYNSCVEGNQELLSIDSEDDDEEMKEPLEAEEPHHEEPAVPLDLSASDHTVPGQAIPSRSPSPPMHAEESSHPPKYKQCILQRYLTDSYQQMQKNEFPRQRNASGSLSSHDYEDMSASFSGSPLREQQFDEHQDMHDSNSTPVSSPNEKSSSKAKEDLYWKEISAALALTTLARSKVSP